ncbi:Uncharacterized protein OBRU01_09895, partial [Operophtera brumata]
MSKHMYSTANLSDKELKEQGNRLFSLRKFEDAMNCYTKAIIKNPSVSTYFTNRALCYLKLKRWELACQDCRRALDIDSNQVKGHFFLGQALVDLEWLINEDMQRRIESLKLESKEDDETNAKSKIEEECRVGHFDPVTRVKLTADQLIPNFTMKEVVDAFLQENEWAHDY